MTFYLSMRPLLLLAAVFVVVGLIFAFFWVLDTIRRAAQRRVRDLDALDRRKLSRTIEADSKAGPEEALARVAKAVEEIGSRFTHRTATELIAFTGLGGGSLQFKGVMGVEPIQMPVRVAIRAKSTISGTRIVVLLDEDFGFHLFVGTARAACLEKYEEAFNQIEKRIRAAA